MIRVGVPGGEVAAVVSGDGSATPAVLLHGLNSGASVWSRFVPHLTGRPVAALDMRGHGASTRRGPLGSARQAADVVAVLDALGWAHAHVVGSSFGGAVGITLAAAYPARVETLSLVGSALAPAPELRDQALGLLREVGVRAFFDAIGPEWTFAPGADPAWIAEAERLAADNDVDVVAELLTVGFTEDFRAAAARVLCPVLVARGQHDRTCTAEVAGAVAAALHVRPSRATSSSTPCTPIVTRVPPPSAGVSCQRLYPVARMPSSWRTVARTASTSVGSTVAPAKDGAKRSTDVEGTRSPIGSRSSASSCARVAAAGLLTKHGASVASTRSSAAGTCGVGTVSNTPSGRVASRSSRLAWTTAVGCSWRNRSRRSRSGSHTANSACRASVVASVKGWVVASPAIAIRTTSQ
ncbi:alpha/beta fold hydrolase [Pseudonocardia sp. TRM90224]|uniref:alpha/beta fold hydrolase n=1 Tax=Pseudonocardia sp. TRM90224 TaxID=2812678 RepID=UPI001E2D5B71|nr:alpha/beta fold hydrolase [Pseudonocardia sp. TRM90224]